MVFCYKIITESPRRSGCSSPRKKSAFQNVPSSISQLVNVLDYDTNSVDLVDAIPEREWRLLGALARKREQDDEREQLADQFRRMWEKEKEEREIVEAETNKHYKRYISRKRREEQAWHEYRQLQKSLQSQLKRRQLIDSINHKEQRTAEVLAWVDDKKTSNLLGKAVDEEVRAILAADRRTRLGEAEQFRKHVQLLDAQKKVDEAGRRRNAILRDASQRVAINNALSSWESCILRQEISALEASWRAHHAARAANTSARSVSLLRAREARRRRARRLAALTEQLRDMIRSGRMSNSYS